MQKPGAAEAMVGRFRAGFRAALKVRLRAPYYPALDCETLLIWGQGDRAYSSDLVAATERLVPGLKVVTIEGAGHFAPAEAPEAVNEALKSFFAQPRDEVREVARAVAQATEFRVVLASVQDNSKISVIKELRGLTGMDLRAAKDLIDQAPSTVIDRTSREQAQRVRDQLTAAGAVIDLQPAPPSSSARP